MWAARAMVHTPPRPPARIDTGVRPPGTFVDSGDRVLEQFVAACLARLPPADAANVAAYLKHKQRFNVGSWCSGTDAPILMCSAVVRSVKSLWNIDLDINHVFSAERDPAKQAFIVKMFPHLSIMFGDACQLAAAESYNVISQSTVPVPGVAWAWFGFPCQDVSSLNTHAADNGIVIADRSKRTGSVFGASVSYAKQHQDSLEMLTGENVLGLMKVTRSSTVATNLQCCLYRLETEALMYVYVLVLCPSLFQKPVTRGRVWISAIPMLLAQFVPLEALDRKATELISEMVAAAADTEWVTDLEYLLLPESSAIVLKHLRAVQTIAVDGRGNHYFVSFLTQCVIP